MERLVASFVQMDEDNISITVSDEYSSLTVDIDLSEHELRLRKHSKRVTVDLQELEITESLS